MRDVTKRFLNSIQIDNLEDFDFDIVKTSKDLTGTFCFYIQKNSKWDLDLLNYFIDKLNNITNYKYQLSFSYYNKISNDDILILLKDFIEDIKDNISIIFLDNNLVIENIPNDKIKEFNNRINDFNSLLDFINYPKINIILNKKSDEDLILNEKNQTNNNDNELDDNSFENEEDSFYEQDLSDYYQQEYQNEEELSQEYTDSEEEVSEFSNDILENFDKEITKESEEYISNQLKIHEKLFEGLDTNRNYIPLSLKDIRQEKMAVMSSGYIYSIKDREIRGNKIYTILVNDNEESKYIEINVGKKFSEEFLESLKYKNHIRFTGFTRINKFNNNAIVIRVNSLVVDGNYPLREDNYEGEKRVELHLHTKMSAMDAVNTIDEFCQTAKNMGHKAIALTDHGVVQAFPAAQKASKKYGIKILYGCEVYMVEDYFKGCFNPNNNLLENETYVVFDLETTGLSIQFDKIIEFGAVKIKNGLVIERKDILINPGIKISKFTTQLTNITQEMVDDKPKINEVIDEIMKFIDGCVLVSHNLEFDFGFLNKALQDCKNEDLKNVGVDTLALSRFLNPEYTGHSLGNVCHRYKIEYKKTSAHRADYDAEVLSKAWSVFLDKLNKMGYKHFNQLEKLEKSQAHYKLSSEMHVNVLCKNAKGLKDLYKIVSDAHIKYLGRYPTVPRSLLEKYRDNLILGSACFNGEVFQSSMLLSKEKLKKAISFYDFIEIQPHTNYEFLINVHTIDDDERLNLILNNIIKEANNQNKLIVATGDVHYLNPEDKIFRDVYVYSAGVGKTAHPLYTSERQRMEEKNIYFDNPNQYFRSTDEMLKEFEKYGSENAYNWVIKNTNLIADMCEEIYPIKDKLYTPTIENCENLLREICYNTAHNLYGDPLPKLIEERLEKELNGIISNGYAVIYYIAHKIIKKTHEDDYIVGSRGSVGSSFVATMANITEVNPLPPHYRCPNCKHFELYEGSEYFSGYDLPTKKCPKCGHVMVGDGQNIPFETFLGFNADKVPDIDLNFPPDYQSRAHEYTKVLLGEQNVFRAGTISTVADKSAFGYAKGYFEKRYKLDKNSVVDVIGQEKLDFLSVGCKDVKKTTGQHPGGIAVIPKEFDVYDFTPIQFPADDITATWKTTHFEYEAIHDNVLKLDLLGHVDPQALKFLRDISGVKLEDIPLNDKLALSIFSSPNALKLQHNYLQLKNGALGIPEFGTEFVRGMLDETKPKDFASLLIISGLSHGENVWRNNAQNLISSNICDIRGVIGCRDDIMTVLIGKYNMDPRMSFNIMEKVRKKDKNLSEEDEKEMRAHGVPDYFIDSCKKIRYLFPKAHATAYVTMAVRVAYFKVHYPLEFYAGFFSVRCDKFDWNAMYKGPEAIIKRMNELNEMRKTNSKEYTKVDEEIEKTLIVALEMYDRGFKFSKIDLYKSDAVNFVMDKQNNALIPPFKVIDGLGDAASESIIEARNEKKFVSIEDFSKRSKITQSQISIFKELGVLKDLPEKEREQMSLFDFF